MSIDLKKALFMEAKPNPRLERFKEKKSEFKKLKENYGGYQKKINLGYLIFYRK